MVDWILILKLIGGFWKGFSQFDSRAFLHNPDTGCLDRESACVNEKREEEEVEHKSFNTLVHPIKPLTNSFFYYP